MSVAIALYQHKESVVPKTEHVVPAEYWGADSLAQRECYQGVPTYRVSGTKDWSCGTRLIIWSAERPTDTTVCGTSGTNGTKGTEMYWHIESVVPKTVHVVYQKETVELLFCIDVSSVICTSRHGNFCYWLITFSILEQLPKTITKNNSSKSPYIEENSHMI